MCVVEDPPLEDATSELTRMGLCGVSEVSMWCKRVDRVCVCAQAECMCVARLVANVCS